jgi:hypothetical protein
MPCETTTKIDFADVQKMSSPPEVLENLWAPKLLGPRDRTRVPRLPELTSKSFVNCMKTIFKKLAFYVLIYLNKDFGVMISQQEFLPSFDFKPSHSFDQNSITRVDFLPNSQCFVLHNVLTADECSQLISQGETYGFLGLNDTYTLTYRTNSRIINYNNTFREILWRRIEGHVDTYIEMCGKHPTVMSTHFTDGVWEKDNLNDNFR